MSLKQRAMQCSAHIPASQYVPVYSRPYRSNTGRWHEELSPITPKPNFDDPYDSRTQSIHDAVKQWLDSSPKSVIGPLYRSRSPSSGSPPSHGSSVEHPVAVASGLSLGRVDSAPMDTNNNRTHDGDTVALASTRESEDKPGDRLLLNSVGESKGSVAIPRIDRQKSCAKEAGPSALAEQATNSSDQRERGGKKRPLKEFKRPDQNQLSESTSESSIRDSSSRALSREFDSVLAAAIIASEANEEVNPIKTPTIAALGGPQIHLKPPRGLEKVVRHEGEHNSKDTVTLHQTTFTTNESSRFVVGGAKANTAESFSAEVHKIEERKCGGEIADQAKDFPAATPVVDHRRFNDGASLKTTDELLPVGSKWRSGTPSPAVDTGCRIQSVASAESTRFKAGDSPAISSSRMPSSHRAGSVTSSYDSRTESSRRRVQPSYHSGGCGTNAANHVFPQHMYELCSPHRGGEKGNRSMRQMVITPEESQKRRNDKSNRKQVSPTKVALEKAKWSKQQARVAAWEDAKNASFLNRFNEEENKIRAWEAQKISKAGVALSKLELDLERRRARAMEKMQYEVALVHQKAQEMKANAESKRAEKAAKAAVQAQILRVVGKSPLSCFCS